MATPLVTLIQKMCSVLLEKMKARWPEVESEFDRDDWEFAEPDDAELERDDDSNDDWVDWDADDELPPVRWLPDEDEQ